jgi:hypothetical protein
MIRLNQDRCGLRPECAFGCGQIREGHLIKAFDQDRTHQIALLSACCERCQRASVEGAFIRDDAVSLRPAACGLVFARRLDHCIPRLRHLSCRKDAIGEARRA